MNQENDLLLMMKIITDRAGMLFASKCCLPLTSAQCRVLEYLVASAGKPVAQKDIERYLGITHSTAKGLLQRLEEKKYVHTAFDSQDKRVKHVYLTERSAEDKERIMAFVDKLEETLFRGLSREELDALVAGLRKIRDNAIKESLC